MNQLNSLILEGNAVKDAEILEPSTGFKVCRFSLAVNRWYKNKNNEGVNEVSYFEVECYGKMAEMCANKVKKGRGIRVVGRLKQDRWKDSENKAHNRIYVTAEHIEYKPIMNMSEAEVDSVSDTSMETQTVTVGEKVPAAVF